MKKYLKIIKPIIAILFVFMIAMACKKEDKRSGILPNPVSLETIELIPDTGALIVKWTPPTKESNPHLWMLKFKYTDAEGTLVVKYILPFENDFRSRNGLSDSVATTADIYYKIDKLLMEEYIFDIVASNKEGGEIGVGRLRGTPLDHTLVLPTPIFNLEVVDGNGVINLKWRTPEVKPWETFEGVRFTVTQLKDQEGNLVVAVPIIYEVLAASSRFTVSNIDLGLYEITAESYSGVQRIVPYLKEDGSDIEKFNAKSYVYPEVTYGGVGSDGDFPWPAEWIVTDPSEGNPEGPLANLTNGNGEDFWTSAWGWNKTLDLDIAFDTPRKVYKINWWPRIGGNTNRQLGELEFYYKTEGSEWTLITGYDLNASRGSIPSTGPLGNPVTDNVFITGWASSVDKHVIAFAIPTDEITALRMRILADATGGQSTFCIGELGLVVTE